MRDDGYNAQELLIHTVARLLAGCRTVATGASSPIPAGGALLARAQAERPVHVSILGSRKYNFLRAGGELFDLAAQGRLDAFFLSGGQIDGHGNINLVGTGGSYPRHEVRWPGSYGSAHLYYLVPRVVLYREEHSRRVMVPQVDFISSPGPRDDGVYRPGGPIGLLTSLCWFSFDRKRRRFRLESVHPGHSLEEVRDHTGFDFDLADKVQSTAAPDPDALALLRGRVAGELAESYPLFAQRYLDRQSRTEKQI